MRPSHSFALVTMFVTSALAMAACGGSDDQYAQDPSQQYQQPTGAYPSAKHATFEAPLIAKIPRLA